ncbi:MAG TPA: PEP-CTERM sorting domain-containing protein [Tepidisphaeraceae bacterium]|nr:PEP-CTERM sorting domain-containing protein [Tepidisphaeraceae bacterium]
MVSIHSTAENDFVHNFGRGDWWIGLTDSSAVSTIDGATMPGSEAGSDRTIGWAWVSGEPYTFHAFGDGEPNDWPGWTPPGEDAGQMRGDGLWNDNAAGPTIGQAPDSGKFTYVVEYRTNSPTRPVDFLPGPGAVMGAFGVREIHKNGGMGNLLDVSDSALKTRDAAKDVIDYTAPVINVWDNGGNGNFGNDSQYQAVALGHAIDPAPGDEDDVNDIMLLATGKLRVGPGKGGTYTFGVNSDDGFSVIIRGKSFTNAAGQPGTSTAGGIFTFNDGRGAQDSFAQVDLPEGDYDIQFVTWEGGGGAAAEFFVAKGALTSFDNTKFALVGSGEKDVRRKAPFVGPNHISVANFNGTTSLSQALAAVQAFKAGTRTPDATGVFNVVNFADPDNMGANRGGTVAYPNDTAGADNDNFATFATGFMTVNEAGKYTFDVLADDSMFFRLLDAATGNPVALFSTTANAADSNGDTINDAFHNDGGCCGDVFGTYDLGLGNYIFELVNNEQGGGASTVLYAALGEHTSFGPQFQLLGANVDDTIHYDGLQLVPEPSTMGILALLAAAGLVRRRRRA